LHFHSPDGLFKYDIAAKYQDLMKCQQLLAALGENRFDMILD
jgi:hypothetical protein